MTRAEYMANLQKRLKLHTTIAALALVFGCGKKPEPPPVNAALETYGAPTRAQFDGFATSGGSWAAGKCDEPCRVMVVINGCESQVHLPTGGVWGFRVIYGPGFEYQYSSTDNRWRRAETTTEWPE